MWQEASTGTGVQQVRDDNRGLLLLWRSRQGGLSRSDIAQRVSLTDVAISRIVRDLINAGLVGDGDPIIAASRPGRRHIGLALVPDAAYIAAVRLTVWRRAWPSCARLHRLSWHIWSSHCPMTISLDWRH
jgi:hypothetical protein